MSSVNRSAIAAIRCHNRVGAIMTHINRYAFRGTSRFGTDCGLSKSTISLLVRGKTTPLYITVLRILKCLDDQLGCAFDFREVFSEDGRYPTRHVCSLVGCRGCLPDRLYDKEGRILPQWVNMIPGGWTGDVNEFDMGSAGLDGNS